MRILIAPDKFKDALDADAVAEALARGVRAARPDAKVICRPLGDGGEGTGRVLATAARAEERSADVLDPLGRTRRARWWLDRGSDAAIVEMAEASGLYLLTESERDATQTTSYGTGQLMRAAIDAGCRDVTLCVGGSATVDGGAGCLQGLGWRLLDAAGARIDDPVTGGTLCNVLRVLPPQKTPSVTVAVLCDVDSPLLGSRGAAPVFGPQKGATAEQVRQLDAALRHWASLLAAFAGRDVGGLPGTGAAGGLPAGLVAVMQARLLPGFEEVARRVGLREQAARCDLILTGEGRLDEQTVSGKVVDGVARLGRDLGKPVVAFVGAARFAPGQTVSGLAERLMLRDVVVITPPGTALAFALAQTRDNLAGAVVHYLRARA